MVEQWQQLHLQLIELQTQLVFQEDTVQALDKIIAAQEQRLDQLEQANMRLARQFTELLSTLQDQGEDARPPHY
ncbi:MAG TPA: SlyX family protein [Spongiibacteraceae bacterium]|jgi:SlyX protein